MGTPGHLLVSPLHLQNFLNFPFFQIFLFIFVSFHSLHHCLGFFSLFVSIFISFLPSPPPLSAPFWTSTIRSTRLVSSWPSHFVAVLFTTSAAEETCSCPSHRYLKTPEGVVAQAGTRRHDCIYYRYNSAVWSVDNKFRRRSCRTWIDKQRTTGWNKRYRHRNRKLCVLAWVCMCSMHASECECWMLEPFQWISFPPTGSWFEPCRIIRQQRNIQALKRPD